ncbi:Ig-like domain-containing protein [Methylomonas sp. MED-D]|uniref:Ig-like domain-containing protein n=1 Tax=Methylomonas sp. MED-D TaxID=3418768 RepID=UPI003CFD6084
MNTQVMKAFYVLVLLLGLAGSGQSAANVLDENCVVNILNRTVQVGKDGAWSMPNVPSQMGRVRARATCTKLGDTFSGESDYFNIVQNGIVNVPDITFENIEPIPVSLKVSEPTVETLSSQGATAQLKVEATYRDGTVKNVTASSNGTNYSSSNPAIVSVNAEGLVTAVSSGSVLITARKDEVVAFKRISVSTTGDADNDGLPDDFELANGLNPNDPLDAQEDPDNDGLTTKREYQLGTNFRLADTDGDGLSDGIEVAGSNGYTTDPLKADSDGDGVNDNDEILAGYNPTDGTDGGGRSFVELIVAPANPTMTFNTVYNEANLQVKVSGKRGNGTLEDITAKSTGTSYSSSNLSVVSFGAKDGLLFAGQAGTANLTVRNGGLEKTVTVTVGSFSPTALSSISIPGYANNVDVAGDFAYVAAGSKGLQIVNVANHASPTIVGGLDTAGTAIDVRVVGNVVYLADGEDGLQIIDVSDPANPLLLASYETAGVAQDVKIDNQFAYVADGNGGLEIVDVHKPAQPIAAGSLGGLGEAKGVDAQGNIVAVVAGTSLHIIDVTDKANPVKKGSLSIGPVKDVAVKDGYAYVSAYTSGFKAVNIGDPTNPIIVASDAAFYPYDVELTDSFAFFAEVLFVNSVPYVNIEDPESAVFQGTVDFRNFNDYNGTGVALDSNYVYLTASSSISDFEANGTSTLLIGQYRLTEDKGGVAPTIEISEPPQDTIVVEGKKVTVTATADDDIGVKSVSFIVDGQTVYTDTSRPYQYPVTVPFGTVGNTITVVAKATDFGGNQQTSTSLTLTVQADTDRDGLSDEQEAVYGSNVNDTDSDDDGLSDGDEVDMHTNPIDTDSDDDGVPDGTEVQNGTDPLNPDVTPPTVSGTSPADASIDIPENNPIIVSFGEPLSAKSINADSITIFQGLLEGGAKIAGKVRLSSDGLQLIFTPSDLLADYTEYKVVVAGVRDRAGNPIATPYSFHYKTGNTVDTTPPTVAAIDPAANSTGVAVNVVVGIRFSEPVHGDTVNDQSVQLYDQVTGQQILGVVTLNGDGQSATFVPNVALAVGRQHRIAVTNAIKDLFGNPLGYVNYYFTTSFDRDANGPRILGFSVGAAQLDVPTNAVLQVQFDEPVSGLSLGGVELRKGGDAIATTRELSGDRKTLTLKLQQPLLANTGYSLHVEGVEDLSGNVLGTAQDRSFTTGAGADLLSTSVVQYSPANNTSGIGLNSPVVITFAERLNPLALNSDTIALYDAVTGQRPSASYALSADGKTVTLTPNAALTANRQYYIYISNWAPLPDQAGNRINYANWYFRTGSASDQEVPLVSGQNIVDGASGIAVNAKLRFVLDEPISAFSVAGSVRLSVGGVDVAGTASLGSDNRTITFTPSSTLAINSDYTVVLDGLYDYIGNRLSTVTSHFTTGASASADTTGATVTISPANAATGVSASAPITFSFSEAIDPTTLDSGIAISASGYSGQLAGSFAQSGNVVTFSPLTPLPGNTQINITVNGVLDLAGNSNSYRYQYFTTGTGGDNTAPQLLSITPNDGAMDVYGNNPIVLTFSESLNQSTVSNNVGLFVNGDVVRPSISYSADSRTVTLNYNLPASALVTVLLTDDIKDLSGNRLADTVKVFTTAAANDTGRPSIATALPGNGAYNVLSKNKIVLYSNEALKASSLAGALHVSQNGVLITGNLQLIGDGRTLVYTPAQPWAKDARIEVFLDSTAQDLSGNALNSFYTSFRTEEDPATKTPYVLALNTDDGITLPLNPAIELQFNEALDPATVDNSRFVLRNYYYGAEIPTTVSLLKGNRVVRLVPNAALQANQGYQIGIRAGVKDASGAESTYNSDYLWYFATAVGATADSIAPKVTALSPIDGAGQVGINNRVSIRFDEAVSPLSFLGDDGDQPLAQVPNYDARSYSLSFSDGNRQVSYLPHEPWPVDSDVTLTVDQPQDYAGNAVVSRSSQFSTGNGPDTASPSVVEWSMAASATNVPVNAVFKARMSEAIDPVTVNDGGLYLYDTVTGQHVPASLDLSTDGRTLTLVPTQALAVGRNYYFYVYSVQDMNGNNAYQSRYFTAALTADNLAPNVVGYSIVADQLDVPTNAVLQVQFDEPVSGLSLGGVELRKGGDAIATTRELSGDRKTLTLKLQQPLLANTGYSLHVEGVEDLSGNVLGTAQDRSFTTGAGADLLSTSVVQYSPANNTSGIGLNSPVVITFAERLNPLALNSDTIALYDAVTGQRPSASYALSADGKTVTLTPNAALTANRQYYIYISNWAPLPDQAGNRINYANWYFRTGSASDQEVPLVSGQNIVDGASGIAVNAKLRFVLDEPISAFSVAGSVRLSVGGVDVAGTASLGSDNRTITFTPSSTLAINSDYTVVLDGLYDYIGNRLSTVTSHFTTGASASADTTGATVTISPANAATGVSASAPITFSFSEAIDPTTLDSGIAISASGYSGQLAGSFAQSGNVVTFSPLTPLPGNTQINITVNGVLDLAGNSNSYRYQYFTTGTGGDNTAPQLLSITPNDGAMDVYGNNPIVLTFSESLNQSTVSNNVGLFVNGDVVRPSISYSADSRTVTLNYNLPASALVTVLLTDDIKDLSGNRLADTVKVFTTAAANDTGRPSIATALPGNGAYNVLSKNKIVLYSNEALKASSLAGALHVSQNGVLITGNLQLIGDGRTLVYTPAQPWAKDARIEVFLDSTAQDLSGNALNSFYTSFRTEEDPATKTPYVLALNTDDGITLPLNPAIELQFNEALDPATVDNSRFVLRNYYYGAEIPTTVSLLKGNRVVRLVPNAALQANQGYQIGIRAGVKDASGAESTYNSDYLWYFATAVGATADSIAPKVTALSPIDGAGQVGINNRVSIRFDEAVSPLSFLGDDGDQPLAQVPNYDARSYSLSFSDGNRQVSYLPHEPWPVDSDVTLTVDQPQDYAGNAVVSRSSQFSTGNGPDTASPSVVEWSMAASATNVPVNAVFKARMSEAIDPVTVNDGGLYLYDTVTGQHVPASLDLSTDGRTLTLVPTQALAVGRNYYFYVYSVQDMNGNNAYQSRYFTAALTADNLAPNVVGYSIVADQLDVPTNAVLQVQFDEPVSGLSLGGVELRKGGDAIATTRELSGDRKTLTLKLQQPLLANTGYSLHVEGVEDLSGNVLGTAQDRSFTTGAGADLLSTSVVQYSPANNTSGIGLNSPVVITFAERLNPLALNSDTIALYDAVTGQRPSASYALSADGKTVTLTPNAALTANRQYYIYISNWAPLPDQAGNRINYANWYFRTGTE